MYPWLAWSSLILCRPGCLRLIRFSVFSSFLLPQPLRTHLLKWKLWTNMYVWHKNPCNEWLSFLVSLCLYQVKLQVFHLVSCAQTRATVSCFPALVLPAPPADSRCVLSAVEWRVKFALESSACLCCALWLCSAPTVLPQRSGHSLQKPHCPVGARHWVRYGRGGATCTKFGTSKFSLLSLRLLLFTV